MEDKMSGEIVTFLEYGVTLHVKIRYIICQTFGISPSSRMLTTAKPR